MNYAVYKLGFLTALHIGHDSGGAPLPSAELTIHSDTLFSALCMEAKQVGGEELLHRLYVLCRNGSFSFSDLFPYRGETYFVPRPILKIESSSSGEDGKERKDYKKLKYISTLDFDVYLASLSGTVDFDVKRANTQLRDIGIRETRQMVSIKGQEETQPFYLGCMRFNQGCGLYLVVSYHAEAELSLITNLLENLGLSGIGGKRSAGLGKFLVEDPIFLDEEYSAGIDALGNLLRETAGRLMLLNTALPRDDELNEACLDGYYMLLRRGGFVQSDVYYQHQVKKKLLYAFAPGSTFRRPFYGDIYDVSEAGNHPVYRNLKPMFLGVNV